MIYTIDSSMLEQNINLYHKFGCLAYPIKTNDSKEIITLIDRYFSPQDTYLISSISHYNILKSCDISPDRITFINILSLNKDREYLYQEGVRSFVFGDLYKLHEFYITHKDISIIIRISLREINSQASILGMSLEDYFRVFDKENVSVELYFDRAIDMVSVTYFGIMDILSSYPVKLYNFGGLSLSILDNVVDVPNLRIEVGEGLLNRCIDCITTVLHKSDHTIFIETGIYGGMLDSVLYNKKFNLRYYNYHFTSEYTTENTVKVLVCGGSCDTKDILGYYYISPACYNSLYEGGNIIIENVGAYFDVFHMRYASDIKSIYRVKEN